MTHCMHGKSVSDKWCLPFCLLFFLFICISLFFFSRTFYEPTTIDIKPGLYDPKIVYPRFYIRKLLSRKVGGSEERVKALFLKRPILTMHALSLLSCDQAIPTAPSLLGQRILLESVLRPQNAPLSKLPCEIFGGNLIFEDKALCGGCFILGLGWG